MTDRYGFTLIEVIMVMVIVAIIAAVALPRFVDLGDEAEASAEAAVIAAVQAGVNLEHQHALVSQ